MRRDGYRTSGRRRPAAAPLAGVLAATALAAPGLAAEAQGIRNRIECAAARAVLDRAAAGALARLRRPECQRILGDFRDGTGRTLRERLDALQESPDGYLARRMWFVDGSGTRACQNRKVIAATAPGSAVVFVCAPQLRRKAFHNPSFVEVALIHEQLHSLGLGEDPPTSLEITAQVRLRCGSE